MDLREGEKKVKRYCGSEKMCEKFLWADLSMLLGHPLAERGGERAKCKAKVAARILDEVKEVGDFQCSIKHAHCTILIAMLLMISPES